MQFLRRKVVILGIFSVIGLSACSWLVYRQGYPLFYIALIVTMLVLIGLYQQLQRLKTAQLIAENAILTSVSAIAAGDNKDQISQLLPDKKSVKVLLSCFGVLSGTEAYKFNCDGIRLFAVEIGRKDMLLRFGTDKYKKYLRFEHGISTPDQIRDIAEKLQYETGVIPTLTGWIPNKPDSN